MYQEGQGEFIYFIFYGINKYIYGIEFLNSGRKNQCIHYTKIFVYLTIIKWRWIISMKKIASVLGVSVINTLRANSLISLIKRERIIIMGKIDYRKHRSSSIVFDNNHCRLVFGIEKWYPRDKGILVLKENSELLIKGNVSIAQGAYIRLRENAKVSIGNGTFINPRTELIAKDKISIGKNCAISWGVTIMDNDGHLIITSHKGVTPESSPINIKDNVWIGQGATILKGVTIGIGSIVAANAVVTKDVPDHTVVAGNPARIVKEGVVWKI